MPSIRQYELKDKATGKKFYRCQLMGTEIFGAGKTPDLAYADLKKNVAEVKKRFLLSPPKIGDKPIQKIPKGLHTRCSCKRTALSTSTMCPHGNFKLLIPQANENNKTPKRKLQKVKSNRNSAKR